MNAIESAIDQALSPLDRARAFALRLSGGHLRLFLRRRSARNAVSGALSVCLAFLGTLIAPLTLLTLGPIVLGVPHLLSDLRYLVVRQGLHRRRALLPAALLLASSCLAPSLSLGTCAVAATALAARTSWTPRLLALLACVAFACAARQIGPIADMVFAHLHNLCALAAWAFWARDRRALVPALALFGLASLSILAGLCDPALFSSAALSPGTLTLSAGELVSGLAPLPDPLLSLRLVACFALAQAVHYSVWLKLLPTEDRARPGVRSFRASYRALVRDLSLPLVLASLGLCAGVLLLATLDVRAARDSYLRLALFHGPLEIAVVLLGVLERRPLARAG